MLISHKLDMISKHLKSDWNQRTKVSPNQVSNPRQQKLSSPVISL